MRSYEEGTLSSSPTYAQNSVGSANRIETLTRPDEQFVGLQKVVDPACHLDLRGRQDDKVIAEAFKVCNIMRGNEHRHCMFSDGIQQDLLKLAPCDGIETGDWFIKK